MVKRVMSLALALGLSLGVASANVATAPSATDVAKIVALAQEAGMTDVELSKISAEVVGVDFALELLSKPDWYTAGAVLVLAVGVPLAIKIIRGAGGDKVWNGTVGKIFKGLAVAPAQKPVAKDD